ncbi:type VI secretion protein IcmF/TssM N-terminal domain-containing protein [Pseudomonas sp. NPDC089422]|uniref:type VI secretion protein IcmF/TssM N-terminal domain-containing protein n=1 Tax=Pseudomonas sp. NPDC089422 TaxID=3364466 RepID=UPI003823DC93
MKALLRCLKNFWFALALVWSIGLLACWFALPRWQFTPEQVYVAMTLFSAVCLLLIVLRQYRRIRAEQNIESLVQLEVDRSLGAEGEFRDQHVLRERLKHAIAMLRSARSAGGGGASALSDLPWYLVIGMSASGKTSLLTRSGLSASIAGAQASGFDSGTQHCDWYFSPEAVLIDTAGRYLRDDASASEFASFLKLLRKQRSKPAVNGLVLVVSLPEIICATVAEREAMAARLVSRIDEYSECLGVNPPLYLMLSKTDLLPGFSQAFEGLDNAQRQQPLGMTFPLAEVRHKGLRSVAEARFAQLLGSLREHVEHQVIAAGNTANVELLQFPSYFAELSSVLGGFLEQFERTADGRTPPIVRGVYFTSALQTDEQLPPVYEEALGAHYALQASERPASGKPASKIGDKSFFITETFRQVVFPDRNLSLYYSRQGRTRALTPALAGAAALAGVALLAWEGVSFHNNRQVLATISGELSELEQAPDQAERLASGQAMEQLRHYLGQFEGYDSEGVPLALGAGLYSGAELLSPLRQAYLQQLRTQALEPIGKQLQVQLRALNQFAETVDRTPLADTGKRRAAKAADAAPGKDIKVFKAPTAAALTTNVPRSGAQLAGQVQAAASEAGQDGRRRALDALHEKARSVSSADPSEDTALTAGLSLSEDSLGRLSEQQVASVIEAYSALKLYLILTRPQEHPDADFVAAELPRAWAQAAQAQGHDIDPVLVEANSALYVRYLQQGTAPALRRNEQLVSDARQSLRSFMIASSLVDREYLRLQLESGRQYPNLTLADMVPATSRNQLFSAEAVPAFYTRQGWEEYVQPELIKLLSGDLRNDSDWVLDGEGGNGLVQKANFMRELLARYKADYAEAWFNLLEGVGVRHFTDMANANERLAVLSDVQNSPVKSLLAAVNHNTDWDLPKQAAASTASAAEDSFWASVKGAFSSQGAAVENVVAQLPRVNDGSLAKRFEPVSRLFAAQNAEGADSTVMDRYLAALRKLKVRLSNIQRSQDVGKNSKLLISETLEGQPSEVTLVRNYVETSVDTSAGKLSGALLRLFNSPLQYTWETLRDPAGQQIAKAWAQDVARPWQQVMAHRYPIVADSKNEASVKDLQRFVDPESGLLPAFKRNEIGNLAGGEGLGMGTGNSTSPLVNTKMVDSIDKASSVGQVIASLSDRENGFEIMLEPSARYTDIIFTLDGQEQHYRNGRTSWNRFAWPGSNNAPGARLDVVTLEGQRITVFDYPGRWGLLKMNDSARVSDLDTVQQRFTWQSVAGPVSLVVRNYGGVKMTDLAQVKALSVLNDSARVN